MKATWCAAAWVLAAGLASGQTASPELQQRLDRPLNIRIDEQPIGATFDALSQASAVAFRVDERTLDRLPYGKLTRLSMVMQDISLRDALPRLLRPNGLRWTIESGQVAILPGGPLDRMGRRASYDELVLLGTLATAEVPKTATEGLGNGDPTALLNAAIQAATDKKVTRVIPPSGIDADAMRSAMSRAGAMLPAPPSVWLDLICRELRLTWRLEENTVYLLPWQEQFRRQLQRRVSVRYDGAALADVLRELAAKADVPLRYRPGALAAVPASVRGHVSLAMSDATIETALEQISGLTGLEIVPTDDGLEVQMSLYLEATAGAPPAGSRTRPTFFLQETIRTEDGKELRVFLVPEDVSPKLREAIERRRAEMLRDLESKLGSADTEPRTDNSGTDSAGASSAPATAPMPETSPAPSDPPTP